MKVVITGASGFIGTQLQNHLKKSTLCEYQVISLVRTYGEKYYTDYSLDSLVAYMDGADVVVHLAAKRGSGIFFNEYVENINLTERVAIAAKSSRVKKVIYASSISVYSDQKSLPWNESQIITPKNLYGLSKYIGEEIIHMNLKNTKTQFFALRLAHVFGANEKNNYMINLFIRQAFLGKTLLVNNLTDDLREFVFVEDVLDAIESCILFSKNTKQFYTMNIGSDNRLSNIQVAKKITEIFNSPRPEVVVNPNSSKKRINEKDESFMDSSLAKELLQYKSTEFSIALNKIKKMMEGTDDIQEIY